MTATTHDIENMRTWSVMAGDLEIVALCDRALGATRRDMRLSGRDEYLPSEYRGRGGMSRAASECARIVEENRARMAAHARDLGSEEV